jgi:nucleoside-diphosphate-sugar epimerase
MRILVTGGAGYIGTTLAPYLTQNGHRVSVLDRFFFGREQMEKFSSQGIASIRDDIRYFEGRKLVDFDAVVDMAALSNDPAGELDPWKTLEINYLGRSRVARLAKEAGVSRYLLVSSCSIYGFQDGLLTEESPTNPLTTYARANMLAERDNLILGDSKFSATVARFATIYGLSGRMRFDLAVNGMVFGGIRNGRIPVMKDGTQWRPFMHVKDAARAVEMILESPAERVNREIFNIGSDNQNYQIRRLGEIVSEALSKRPAVEWYGTSDQRSYRVSFEKARKLLGFAASWTPVEAAREIEEALASGRLSDSPKTMTVEWYKHLLSDPVAGEEVALRGSVI